MQHIFLYIHHDEEKDNNMHVSMDHVNVIIGV
jgi:hypothetical protein